MSTTTSNTVENAFANFNNLPKEQRTVRNLFNILGTQGFGLIFIFLGLPSSLPIPTGGIAHVFAALLLIIVPQYWWGREYIWLPKFVSNRKIAQKKDPKFIAMVINFNNKISKHLNTRGEKFVDHKYARLVIGPILYIGALGMLTYVPFADTIPSLGIVIIGFSMLERDSIAMVAGSAIVVIGSVISLIVSWGSIIALINWLV